MEKLVDWFAVFTKIIHYVSIFLKINFIDVVQKMPIEGASDFREPNNNFLTYFLYDVKIILNFRFYFKF